MELNEYQSKASYTNKQLDLTYYMVALCGEAGEVANEYKKYLRGDFDRAALQLKCLDEYGDVLWYITQGAAELGITLEDIAQYNLDKLEKRYGKKGTYNKTN